MKQSVIVIFCFITLPVYPMIYYRGVGRPDGTMYLDVSIDDGAAQVKKNEALLYGARNNSAGIVATALSVGADPSVVDVQGKSAIVYAQESRNQKMIALVKKYKKKKG